MRSNSAVGLTPTPMERKRNKKLRNLYSRYLKKNNVAVEKVTKTIEEKDREVEKGKEKEKPAVNKLKQLVPIRIGGKIATDVKKIEDEEKEEFENVNGQKPVQCRPKMNTKLRWVPSRKDQTKEKPTKEEKTQTAITRQSTPALSTTSIDSADSATTTSSISEKKEDDDSQMEIFTNNVLDVIKTNQLLERAIDDPTELKILNDFFSNPNAKPSHQVVILCDRAISHAIHQLMCNGDSTLCIDTIDVKTRQFLLDENRAKKLLLTTMLKKPQFVPKMWGGGKQWQITQEEVDGVMAQQPATKTPPPSTSN